MQKVSEQSDISPRQCLSTDKVSLIDCLQPLAKRSRMIYLVTLSAAVLSLAGSFILPDIYTAKTLILPAPEDKGIMSALLMGQAGGLASLAGATLGVPTTAELYVSMLKSEAIKDPIIDKFKLIELYDKKYRMDVYKKLDKRVSVAAGKKDGIITITVDDRDPKLAAAMANSYVDELGRLAVRLNVTGAGQNRAFIEERLAASKADLAQAEEKLKSFQSRNKAVQVTAQAEASIKEIAALNAQLAADEVQLAIYRRQFTDSSQEVKSLNTSKANLKSQIARLEGGGGNSVIPTVGSIPALGQEYVRLMREFKIQESLSELLTKQYEIAKFSEAKDIAPFEVVLKARVPEKKRLPLRSLIVVITSLAAFLGSIFTAFILDAMEALPDDEKKRLKILGNDFLFRNKPSVKMD